MLDGVHWGPLRVYGRDIRGGAVAPARVGLWSERLQDRGLTGSGALGPAVIGDDGPRWMVYIGGRCTSKGGISGNGPGLRRRGPPL